VNGIKKKQIYIGAYILGAIAVLGAFLMGSFIKNNEMLNLQIPNILASIGGAILSIAGMTQINKKNTIIYIILGALMLTGAIFLPNFGEGIYFTTAKIVTTAMLTGAGTTFIAVGATNLTY